MSMVNDEKCLQINNYNIGMVAKERHNSNMIYTGSNGMQTDINSPQKPPTQ